MQCLTIEEVDTSTATEKFRKVLLQISTLRILWRTAAASTFPQR